MSSVSQIDSIVLFDRSVDLITPMCSQVYVVTDDVTNPATVTSLIPLL